MDKASTAKQGKASQAEPKASRPSFALESFFKYLFYANQLN
jgi:hypothetical protein